MESKKFMVADAAGQKTLEPEQLATFAYYIQNIQFRFVVTKLPGEALPSVTHRDSGKRVTGVSYNALSAARGDYAAAALIALKGAIEKAGEARVRSVLSAA